jgi:hypothetical protein
MDNVKAPDMEQIIQQMDGLNTEGDGMDVIKKPRTNFSSNVLRRAIPNMNIQDKIGSISMNKLNVLSTMRLGNDGGSANFG